VLFRYDNPHKPSEISSSLAFVAAALNGSPYSLMQKHFAGEIGAVISESLFKFSIRTARPWLLLWQLLGLS